MGSAAGGVAVLGSVLAAATAGGGPAWGQAVPPPAPGGVSGDRGAVAVVRAVRDTTRLDLREAVERALGRYPTVAASRSAAEAARASRERARAAWWPEVGVAGSLTRYQEPMIVSPIHDFQPGATPDFDETLIEGGGYLTWTLFDGGARQARIRQAGWEASATEADLDATAQSLVADVASAFLEVLSRTRVLAAHDRRIAALEAELDRVRQLREVGRAAEVEVLRVEAALASGRSDRVAVAAALDVARRELARLMDAPPAEPEGRGLLPLRFAGTGLPSREELVRRATVSSPMVEGARRRRTAAEAGLSLARSVRWPDLQLFGSWVDHAGIDSDHQVEWAAGVRFRLPVFTGGRVSGEVARAEAETRGAGERVRLAVTEIERAVDRAASAVEETEARARSLETAVARSREVVRIEKLRLDTGTGTQTDYLDAEADLLAVEAALAETGHASIRARVELARLMGRLGPDWLEENLEVER